MPNEKSQTYTYIIHSSQEKDIGIEAEKAYLEVIESHDIKSLPIVENILREAIAKTESNISSNMISLSNCQYFQGNHSGAVQTLKELLEREPENYEALTFLAVRNHKGYSTEEYIKLIEKSYDIITKRTGEIISKGLNATEDETEEVISLNIMQGINYIEKGEYHFNKRDYPLAESFLKHALILTPKSNGVNTSVALAMLGEIYLGKDINIAENYFREAIKYENCIPGAYLKLADIYLKKNQYKEAIKECINAFEKNNNFIYGNNNEEILDKTIEIFDTHRKNQGTLKDNLLNVKLALEETGTKLDTSKILLAFFQYAQGCLKDKSVNEDAANMLFMDPCLSNDNGSFANLRRDITQIIRPTHLILVNTFGNLEYLIKMNNPENNSSEIKQKMKDEYVTQSFLSSLLTLYKEEKCLEKDLWEVEEPLFYLENEKNFVSIQRRIKSITLKEFETEAEKESLEPEIYLAIKTNMLINVLATHALRKDEEGHYFTISDGHGNIHTTRVPKFDYTENLERRFLNRLKLTQKQKEEYKELHFYYVDRWTNGLLNYFLHGDMNACNALLGGRLIDFEMKAVGNPVYDFMHFITNIDFSDMNQNNLQKYFIKQMAEHNLPKEHIITMMQTMEQNRIHTQICKIGSNINQKNYPRAKEYLDATLRDLERMNQKVHLKALEKVMKGQLPC